MTIIAEPLGIILMNAADKKYWKLLWNWIKNISLNEVLVIVPTSTLGQ